MLAVAPFYDLLRGRFFPDVQLLGAWQDIVVIALALCTIPRVTQPGFRVRLSWLDVAVIAYILAYLSSVLFTSSIAVWFYMFRWCCLFALFYLVVKLSRFTERDLKQFVGVITVSLVASAAVGYGMYVSLGNRYWELWKEMGLAVYGREGIYRWPATFGSSLVASAAFGLLLIISVAHILEKKWIWIYPGILVIAVLALTRTLCRNGWLVGIVGSLVIVCASSRRKSTSFLVMPAVAVLLASAVVVAIWLTPEMGKLVSISYEGDDIRLQEFTYVLQDAVNYPFGVGLGTAAAASRNAAIFAGKTLDAPIVVGDSVLLAVLRDTGWLGFLTIIGVCIGFVTTALRAFRNAHTPTIRLVALVSLAYSAGQCVNLLNMVDVWPTKLYFWFFGALAVAIVDGRVEKTVAKPAPTRIGATQIHRGNPRMLDASQ